MWKENGQPYFSAAVDANELDPTALEHPDLQSVQDVAMMCEYKDFPACNLIRKDVGYVPAKYNESSACQRKWTAKTIHENRVMGRTVYRRLLAR